MAQFDVYRNPNQTTQKLVPYLLDVQTDLLEGLSTRVVVPLARLSMFTHTISRLNPIFQIKEITCVLSTGELAGVSRPNIGEKVASLESHRAEIIRALDFLITGI